MSDLATVLSERARELRDAFDRSFATPLGALAPDTVDFIALRVGGDPYAIRMGEIAGLHTGLSVTAVPGPIPELTGIAGIRGIVTPVYDLAALLGHPRSAGRWAVLAGAGELALAFDDFEDHFRVEQRSIVAHRGAAAQTALTQFVEAAGSVRTIIDIPALVAAIRARLPQSPSAKE